MFRRVTWIAIISVGLVLFLQDWRPARSFIRQWRANREIIAPTLANNASTQNGEFLQSRTIYSYALGQTITSAIILPPSYSDLHLKKYPLIVWLHGANGGTRSLIPLSSRFHDAMVKGLMPESIILLPESEPLSMWVNSYDKSYPIEDALVRDILPHIRNSYRVSLSRSSTTVAGFSMGGYGAARLGFKYSQVFGRIVMIGAGTLDPDLSNTPRADARTRDYVMSHVFGSSTEYFFKQSPRYLSSQYSRHAFQNPISITIVVGDQDEVYSQNLAFYKYLISLGLEPRLFVLSNVKHDLKSYFGPATQPSGWLKDL